MKSKLNYVTLSSLLLLLYIFTLLPNIITARRCGVDLIKPSEKVMIDMKKDNLRNLKSSPWENIRIHFDYTYLINHKDKISKEDVTDLTEKIMPKTKEILEKLLKVKRYTEKLILNAPTCDVYPIPDEYYDGVEADIVIFVIVDISGYYLDNQIEAAASHCLQHSEIRRPVAGYIQFKPNLDVRNNPTALDYMVWLTIHEISHILVMNNSLYDDYINSETLEPIGYDRIIGKYKREDGKNIYNIKSSKVVEAARKHFNCSDLNGVPLEYNGGSGTVGSHWAKKYMNTDYLIGDSYGENLISEISLALFEDSGWYQVDYKMANLFIWGKNKGCSFFNKKCGEPLENEEDGMKTEFKDEFCTQANVSMCSISHVFRGSCMTFRYSDRLKPSERYFKDPFLGGYDELTDKCPIAFEIKSDFSNRYYPGSCRVGNKDSLNLKIEKICPECACFMSSLKKPTPKNSLKISFREKNKSEILLKDGKYLASCFQFECRGSELWVVIDDKKLRCKDEDDVKIEGYEGSIKCPRNDILCNSQYDCKFGCAEKYKNVNVK